MYPHRIRLLGPWECEPLAPAAPPRRLVPPARLRNVGLGGFAGAVRLTCRFGYPGRIDSYEHVWLTFADIAGPAAITLNDRLLAERVTGAVEFAITDSLQSRNRLVVLLDAASDAAGLPAEIALEVRRDAFLRQVSALLTATATCRSPAASTAARPARWRFISWPTGSRRAIRSSKRTRKAARSR